MSQEVRLNGMTQANEIRPNNPAMPLTQALEGVEDVDWTLCPDPELSVNGVSVSSTDMEEGWIFIAIPGRLPIFCAPFFEAALGILRCVEQLRSG